MVVGCEAWASDENTLSTVDAPAVLLVELEVVDGAVMAVVELGAAETVVSAGSSPRPQPGHEQGECERCHRRGHDYHGLSAWRVRSHPVSFEVPPLDRRQDDSRSRSARSRTLVGRGRRQDPSSVTRRRPPLRRSP